MSTPNIHLKYRTPKRYPTVISVVPPGVPFIVLTLRGSNYRCLEQIFMVPKGFEPSKFDCRNIHVYNSTLLNTLIVRSSIKTEDMDKTEKWRTVCLKFQHGRKAVDMFSSCFTSQNKSFNTRRGNCCSRSGDR